MVDIDWSKLKFSYTKTRAIVYSRCIDGEWEAPVLTEDFNITLSSFAGVFHYAPACFEGLKAFRGVDGKIRLFRPDMNAKRMADSARYLDMPFPSEKLFIHKQTLQYHLDRVYRLTGYNPRRFRDAMVLWTGLSLPES